MTYRNPILFADRPDPDVVRTGEDLGLFAPMPLPAGFDPVRVPS